MSQFLRKELERWKDKKDTKLKIIKDKKLARIVIFLYFVDIK